MANIQKTNSEISTFVEFLHNKREIESFHRDIYLITVDVAGLMFIDNIDDIFPKLEKGEYLQLFREKQNYYDEKAILVKFNGDKIGYVPRKHNKVLANLMDAGKELYGVIEKLAIEPAVYIGEDDYRIVEFKIFMKD